MKKNKRPQAQKPRRSADHQARVMDIRSSSASGTHRQATDYRRKPKHPGRGWDA